MVFVSSFSSVASAVDENTTETTSKIEEQLEKDLGAEKAEELLTSKNEYDNVIKEENQIKEIEKENETEANDNVDEMVIEPGDLTYSEEIICR